MTIRLPADLHEALREVAFATRRPMNGLIIESLRRSIEPLAVTLRMGQAQEEIEEMTK